MTLFRNPILLLSAALLLHSPIKAQKRGSEGVRITGGIAAVAIPAASLATTLILKDYPGTKQLVLGGAVSFAATNLLKLAVDKERPDGSNRNSFPSLHTSVAFQGAAFLQRRYGWKFGIPAYALAAYAGWSRIYSRKHDFWDVAVGAVIGVGSSYIFTRPFAEKHHLTLCPVVYGNGIPGLHASFDF